MSEAPHHLTAAPDFEVRVNATTEAGPFTIDNETVAGLSLAPQVRGSGQ